MAAASMALTSGVISSFPDFSQAWTATGIRVNTLSPGAIDTPIIAGQFKTKEEAEGAKQFFASITPLGRIGRPEELAKAILFLASDDSSYSTGIDLVTDGGITQVWWIRRSGRRCRPLQRCMIFAMKDACQANRPDVLWRTQTGCLT